MQTGLGRQHLQSVAQDRMCRENVVSDLPSNRSQKPKSK